jgi:hypothetical protein
VKWRASAAVVAFLKAQYPEPAKRPKAEVVMRIAEMEQTKAQMAIDISRTV